MLPPGERRRVLLLGRMPQGQVLSPGDRRRAEAINVLLPGAKAEGVLLLRRMPQGSTVTGGTLQGESLKRKLVGFIRGEGYYTKSIIFLKRERGSAATGGTSYGAYDIGRVLPPGEHHRRKPQGAAIGGSHRRKLLREAGAVSYSYEGEYLI